MRGAIRAITALLLLGQWGLCWGYSWDQDMVDQPSAKPQKFPAPPEPDSVPIVGGETMPAPATDDGMREAKDAAAAVPNPVPVTVESLARGAYLYEMNCLVCHGKQGQGDGPVGLKFVTKAPQDLHEDYIQDQADGQLFFTLTRGRKLMPFYRDALRVEERWDVINYIRHEFGKK
ncbi:MAG: cytochrome c [Pseudomonadota bacterium]|jgi:mono/diheme cytochrome c family protein|nr:cytochrome c [Pseudomonadota bacterium]